MHPGAEPIATGARNGAQHIQTRDPAKAPGPAGAEMGTPVMSRSVPGSGHCFTIRICLMRASRRLPGRRQLRAGQVDLHRSAGDATGRFTVVPNSGRCAAV
jgi:hypothetical protein